MHEDESVGSLEDFEQYEERIHVGRKVSKVDSFKRLLFNKVEDKRSKSNDVSTSTRIESKDTQHKGSLVNVSLPQPCDYEVSCLDRHDRWHLLQNKNLHSSDTHLDGASTVANVNQVIDKFPKIHHKNLERFSTIQNKKQNRQNSYLTNINNNYGLNSLPRNTKISRSEESGYDSDIVRSVANKSVKSEESESSGLSGYTSDTDTDRGYKEPKRVTDCHHKQRSKSITPDKPPRKSRELVSNASSSKPITRSNSQPSASARMSLSAKFNERQEASSKTNFKV